MNTADWSKEESGAEESENDEGIVGARPEVREDWRRGESRVEGCRTFDGPSQNSDAEIGGKPNNAGAHFSFLCTVRSERRESDVPGDKNRLVSVRGIGYPTGTPGGARSVPPLSHRSEFTHHAIRREQPSTYGIGRRRSVERMRACTRVLTHVLAHMFMCSCMRACVQSFFFGVEPTWHAGDPHPCRLKCYRDTIRKS